MKRQEAKVVRVHELKTWPRFFRDLIARRKHTELRRHDRDFQVGDTLLLREWQPRSKTYTRREIRRVITHMYATHEVPGFCVLELEEVAE